MKQGQGVDGGGGPPPGVPDSRPAAVPHPPLPCHPHMPPPGNRAQTNPRLHDTIIERLMDTFPAVRASRVCSCALWIISEYCTRSAEEIAAAVEMIKGCLGPLPLFRDAAEDEEAEAEAPSSLPIPIQMAAARPAVLADGSYATQTALPGSEAGGVAAAAAAAANVPNLRCVCVVWVWGCRRQGCRVAQVPAHLSPPPTPHQPLACSALLLGGDFFLGAVVAATLTKLVLRLRALHALPPASLNRLTADVMALIAAMLRLGESGACVAAGVHPLDADSRDRMATCLRTLTSGDAGLEAVWLQECRDSFATLITDKQQREAAEAKQEVGGAAVEMGAVHQGGGRGAGLTSLPPPRWPLTRHPLPARRPAPQKSKAVAQPDELIDFHHLKMRKGMSKVEVEDRWARPGHQQQQRPACSAGLKMGSLPLSCLPPSASSCPTCAAAGPRLMHPSCACLPVHPPLAPQRGLRPGARHRAGRRRSRRLQPPQQDCAADGVQRPHLRRGVRHGYAALLLGLRGLLSAGQRRRV